MQYQTPLNKFVPELQEVLKEFARKSHAINLIVTGKLPTMKITSQGKDEPEERNYRKAIFIDPRFPNRTDPRERVGAIDFVDEDNKTFKVESRLIKNDKYRKGSTDYHTKTSSNASKVVKILVDYVKPYFHDEMFDFNESTNRDLIGDWRGEHYSTGGVGWTMYANDLYEEIKHLRSMGVQFKTENFRTLSANLEQYEEHKSRARANVDVYHVFISDGRVAVTKKTINEYGHVDEKFAVPTMYDSIESLPEDLLANVSMLKILGGEPRKIMRGIGYRVSDNEFYVMKPLASNTNA